MSDHIAIIYIAVRDLNDVLNYYIFVVDSKNKTLYIKSNMHEMYVKSYYLGEIGEVFQNVLC